MHALTINQLPCWNVNLLKKIFEKGLSGLEYLHNYLSKTGKPPRRLIFLVVFSAQILGRTSIKNQAWNHYHNHRKSTVVATCNCIIRVTICCNTKRRIEKIELLKKTWKMLLLFLLRQNPFGEGTRAKMQFYGFNRMRMKRLWRINACEGLAKIFHTLLSEAAKDVLKVQFRFFSRAINFYCEHVF